MGLEIAEMLMALESEFGVTIPNAELTNARSVGDFYLCFARKISPSAAAAHSPFEGALWERFLDIVAESTGVERHLLRPEIHFVEDLGLG